MRQANEVHKKKFGHEAGNYVIHILEMPGMDGSKIPT